MQFGTHLQEKLRLRQFVLDDVLEAQSMIRRDIPSVYLPSSVTKPAIFSTLPRGQPVFMAGILPLLADPGLPNNVIAEALTKALLCHPPHMIQAERRLEIKLQHLLFDFTKRQF